MAQTSAVVEKQEQSVHPRASRPIDLAHLAKQCFGDEFLEREILRLYDQSIGTYMSRLQLASSFDDIAMTLHTIKGASNGVGAWGIGELAQTCEADLRLGRPLSPERIADIGLAVEEVRGFIANVLSVEPTEDAH
jgi:HPt (histidine-containing phosphotransfer) domain-containing protein